MKKEDFVAAVASQSGVAPKLAEAILDAVATVTTTQLAKGERVRVPGLANFVPKAYAARPGRNLSTGEPCMVPAATRIRVTPVAAISKAAQQS